MRRVTNGFTIIEVMIFLAVSSALIASAWGLIAGRQEQVMFDQKVRDTQSKIQQWISDVSTGATNGDPSQQYCVINPAPSDPNARPQIVDPTGSPAKPSDYSPQCTFLGKAIQFTDINFSRPSQASTLYAYSVFGCRLDANCSVNGNLPKDMYSAKPEPAIGGTATINLQSYTFADLTETFDLSPAYVTSVCSLTQPQPNPPPACTPSSSYMIGFMNSFNDDLSTKVNGSEDLNVFRYGLSNNDYPANNGGNNAYKCLEGTNPPACQLSAGTSNPQKLYSYQFCLSDGSHYAHITISSASGVGASTQLEYVGKTQC